MQPEIEVKFLGADHDAVRAKLKVAGGHCEQPMRLMRRTVFALPGADSFDESNDGFVRVRDEGDKITMTYKLFHQRTVDSAREIEVVVNDYQKSIALLEALRIKKASEQESKRETWRVGGCEVVLDEWPWIEPFIEIEGPNEAALKKVAKQLGFDWKQAVFGSVTAAYRKYFDIPYELSVAEIPVIAFGRPLPKFLASRKK